MWSRWVPLLITYRMTRVGHAYPASFEPHDSTAMWSPASNGWVPWYIPTVFWQTGQRRALASHGCKQCLWNPCVPASQLQVVTTSPSFIVSKQIEHCVEPGTFTIQCLAHPLLPTSVLTVVGIGADIFISI